MEMDRTSSVDSAGRCCLCHRIISAEIDSAGDLEAMSICRDCKFIFFEDSVTTQTRYNNNSFESFENMLPQQFPDMQPSISDRVNQSRQRRRVLSDAESDGYYSVLGEGDILSYDSYASDSDASVDVVTFLDDNDVSAQPLDVGDGGDNDDDEFEEVENTPVRVVGGIRLHRSLATNGRNLPANWLSEIFSDESIRNSERRRLFGILEEQDVETSGYVDAETDSSRLGAPPAAVWFVNNLARVVVDEKGLVCVICKDSMFVSSVVNRLPCSHVYHPSCIIPWLNARNTCPLCRYELPTDDKDKSNQESQEPPSSSESVGRRWRIVAAPLVSVVGIGVVLWLGGVIFGGQRDDRGNNSRRWWLLL